MWTKCSGKKSHICLSFPNLLDTICGTSDSSAWHGQLALVNMDVMENPPPVPVRWQKYWRLHLYTWYQALSSGQRDRLAQSLRFSKSRPPPPLPKLNLFNIGHRGSAFNRSLILKIKLNPVLHTDYTDMWHWVQTWLTVNNHTHAIDCWQRILQEKNGEIENSCTDDLTKGTDI